ncbi:sugar ABC transporter permease [Paeniglutamicibacter psychrophenolicus]|uniref:Raffinose/stachyose/melibiose transport system permease protein n=1 Tax=Paeniglutamicibacter psychrophenolicus TaxID=257454 RepID=A0ABS4WGW7_9MICC|nr:sugar ABC transporter permease [Paeniglutamicibacter psychrophenolicus]MBP2374814.1 raffinose/stachyose/melibiose transport system permease protein [Paeniglutamicibacter psychrophenolicus]
MSAPAHVDAPPAVITTTTTHGAAQRKVDPSYYWMIVPVLVLFAVFSTVPALIGGFYSFTNYAGYGDWNMVGLRNFQNIFTDPEILASYGFTFFFAIAATLAVNVVALLLALGLNAKIKWKTGIRGVFFIPMVLSGLIIAYVFNFLFSSTLPAVAETLGITPLATSILANEEWAWAAIVFVTVWQAAPGATIIYLAGLQSISTDVFEAAALDGAGPWRQVRSISLPLIVGYVLINIILGFKGYLGTYEVIVALTGGGPGTATQSVAMRIFSGFAGGDYSYQMANAVVFFIITLIISLLQLQILRRREVTL